MTMATNFGCGDEEEKMEMMDECLVDGATLLSLVFCVTCDVVYLDRPLIALKA